MQSKRISTAEVASQDGKSSHDRKKAAPSKLRDRLPTENSQSVKKLSPHTVSMSNHPNKNSGENQTRPEFIEGRIAGMKAGKRESHAETRETRRI
jgi:hypothetical protein